MSLGSVEQHVIVRMALMHYSITLTQSHDNRIIGFNDGISDGHFPEIHAHNILIREGTIHGLLRSSLGF